MCIVHSTLRDATIPYTERSSLEKMNREIKTILNAPPLRKV